MLPSMHCVDLLLEALQHTLLVLCGYIPPAVLLPPTVSLLAVGNYVANSLVMVACNQGYKVA
jgi:hypothetical protein